MESPLPPLYQPEVLGELCCLTRAPARAVADVKVLRDGGEAFPAMLDLIAAAKEEVLFENFIFAGDATGRRFARALGDAARRGVDVRVLYDPVGTMMVRGGSIAKALAAEGLTARPFRPVSVLAPWTWARLRHRDHRKTLTVDRAAAVVGGLCISDNWASHGDGGHNWRDTALLVRGEIAGDVRIAFEGMWERAPGPDVPPPDVPLPDAPVPPCGIVAADRPGAHHVAGVYEYLAARAQESLDITDAYLVTPERVVAAFESAARRGVRVRFLLPGTNNHPVAGASSRRLYARLMASGAEIYEWRGVMVHAKTAVVDGQIALVGSSNLDPLSMDRNYELNLLVACGDVGARMRETFEDDLHGARRVSPELWAKRPLWQKAAETAAKAFDNNL